MLGVALVLLTAPLMMKSCFTSLAGDPDAMEDLATKVAETKKEKGSSRRQLQFSTGSNQGLGSREITEYLEVRRRARRLRDDRVGRGQWAGNAVRDAARELGRSFSDFLAVSERINRVVRLEGGSNEERNAVYLDWRSLIRYRKELRDIGIVLPEEPAVQAFLARRTIEPSGSDSPWGPQTPTEQDEAEWKRERTLEEERRRREELRWREYLPQDQPQYVQPYDQQPTVTISPEDLRNAEEELRRMLEEAERFEGDQ